MAKITRKTAKIFGETATSTGADPAIGQFGSGKAGTYVGTGDIATIQGLAAWSNGWIDAVTPTQQFPPLPEMTGVHKVLSYQNAYILQEGVAEYDASTTYYTDSLVKARNSSNEISLYKSLVDNNTGNAVTNTTYWKEIPLEGWADTNLSNLTSTGNNRLHALKGYEDAGELLTDPEGLADVLYYYHSTFDESKFTIGGSPTITDGVVSNFSASNFITLTTNYTATTALKITFKFTTPAFLLTNEPIVAIRNSDNTKFVDIWVFDGGLRLRAITSANVNKQFTISANTTYYAQIEYSGGSWTGRISTDGINWTQQTLGSADILSPIVNTIIGRYSGTTYEGTVDLKYFSIYTNNVPVFSGNKTGRDVVPVDGYSETIGYSYSKTGSKIVDSYYRGRVNNVYSYYGYAPYYTVSDTDFTLPQGEIYGMIERATENEIGMPIFTLSNTLKDGEIWLEGATVSRTTYASLYAVYGETYGAGDGSTTFKLPDFRGRTIWGADTFGYISAGLPAHEHYINITQLSSGGGVGTTGIYPSSSPGYTTVGIAEVDSLYGQSDTVQPPSIKVRVKTRYA